jgi:hypothetical protein
MIVLEEKARNKDGIRDTQLRFSDRPKNVCVSHTLHSH